MKSGDFSLRPARRSLSPRSPAMTIIIHRTSGYSFLFVWTLQQVVTANHSNAGITLTSDREKVMSGLSTAPSCPNTTHIDIFSFRDREIPLLRSVNKLRKSSINRNVVVYTGHSRRTSERSEISLYSNPPSHGKSCVNFERHAGAKQIFFFDN